MKKFQRVIMCFAGVGWWVGVIGWIVFMISPELGWPTFLGFKIAMLGMVVAIVSMGLFTTAAAIEEFGEKK